MNTDTVPSWPTAGDNAQQFHSYFWTINGANAQQLAYADEYFDINRMMKSTDSQVHMFVTRGSLYETFFEIRLFDPTGFGKTEQLLYEGGD